MAPGASSTNGGFREFYAPRVTEPPKTSPRQSMPQVERQRAQKPIGVRTLHGSAHRTKPDDHHHQIEAGFLHEIKDYKAGDEFVLLWKWVDEFIGKRRAKNNSSKLQNANKPTTRQPKASPSSSRGARQVPKPAVTSSPEAVRRQATEREDLREYQAQRHTLWGELFYLYQSWKDQQAKKKADQARQRKRQATERREEQQTRGRSTDRREPPRNTPSPPDQDHAAGSGPGIARKPIPVYNKKTGEVPKHAVKINQLPPVHNSIHLQHTPSNNYRTKPSPTRGQKNKPTRETRFSDFLHEERKPAASRETQWTYAVPGEDDELARRETRFSSILDPAKAIKKAREAEKAKGPTCYICGSSECPGGYRDNITNLWVCEACQKSEKLGPVQCSLCGQPNSPDTGYADNGLWMCTACRCPTTPKELAPTPKISRKATSKPKTSRPPIPQGVDKVEGDDTMHCECDSPCPPIENFDDERISICPICEKRLTPFPAIPHKSALRLNKRDSYISLVPISEDNSDHLYSDDSYEPAERPIGLGITFQDSEENEEGFRPTPPLKDSKYYHESPTFSAMDYNQSYLHKSGTKHPYAPSPGPAPTTTRRKASVSFAQDLPKTPRHQQNQSFNPTTYPYPSPPSTPTSLHKPRPASSVYPADEPAADFPYPPPPIPQKFANRPRRSSSVTPGTLSKAALARTVSGSPRSQSSTVSTEGGKAVLNRRSSWYDFWKPVFEKTGEKSP